MAIVTMMRIEGDPDELLKQKHEVIDPVREPLSAQNGGIEHIAAKTDNGLLIINVWEHEEGMEKVAAEVRPKAQAAGMADPTDWQQYEIVQREAP